MWVVQGCFNTNAVANVKAHGDLMCKYIRNCTMASPYAGGGELVVCALQSCEGCERKKCVCGGVKLMKAQNEENGGSQSKEGGRACERDAAGPRGREQCCENSVCASRRLRVQ